MVWEREVVVITGGGGGLGGVLGEVLGMRGGGVGVLDLKGGGEEGVDGEEEGMGGGRVRWYKCDVGDAEEVERVWERVVSDVGGGILLFQEQDIELACFHGCLLYLPTYSPLPLSPLIKLTRPPVPKLGTPTILINNAAISAPSPFLTQTPSSVSRVFAVNTLAHFTLTRLFLRTLLTSPLHRRKNRGGHIVTVSSVLGHLGAANLSAYTASKAALLAYHASLSAELRQIAPAVKTILVAQGQLDTAMFREVRVRGWLQRFLGPVVGAQEVAVGIVRLLDQGRGGEVRVPVFAKWVAWLFVLPVGVGRVLRDFSGVDDVVEGEVGMGLPDGWDVDGERGGGWGGE